MTNERWRAEMPALEDWEFFDAVREDFGDELESIVTRANAELDAAEAEKAALKQGNTELRALLEASWDTMEWLETENAALTKERNELMLLVAKLEGELEFAWDDGNDPLSAKVKELESELAARRASDEDVRTAVAWTQSANGSALDALEAGERLLACDWLKKEGGS